MAYNSRRMTTGNIPAGSSFIQTYLKMYDQSFAMLASLRTALSAFEGCGCLLLFGFAVRGLRLPAAVRFCRSRAAIANCSARTSALRGPLRVGQKLPVRLVSSRCGFAVTVQELLSGLLMHLHFQEHCRCRSFNGSCLRTSHSFPASDYFQARGLYRRSGFTPCPEDMRMQM